MCVCVCLPVLSVYMMSEMSHPSGAGVTGSNESPAVGAGNRIWVQCKSSLCS